ncbi:MAG: hypothetical protein ACXWU6_14770, partial [Allosphingosinicella sp.]
MEKAAGRRDPAAFSLSGPVQSPARAILRRATRAAAAAPNNRIIGGAGTSVPPLVLETLPELEALVDELVLLEVDALVETLPLDDVLVEVPPPKLDDEEVVETLPVEVDEVVET